ncbi:aldo/keto reductase [Marinibaculum pumilum]|uniref:Aldo/keto reductase n=1 Tax=Marinibaculum pumilum TaxID=1766165 RepID=A0ABV7L5P6_9PROT
MAKPIATVALPGGMRVPVLGQGSWGMGEDASVREAEIAALQAGIDLGMTLIDTAEMYADGSAEQVVAAAIDGRRDAVFLVSKVLPEHADRDGTIAACEGSLKRLRTDRLDLYLLHWRGGIPLEETLEGMLALQRAGKIRHWGVSNFDTADLEELEALAPPVPPAVDQVLYSLIHRGIEFDLLPWCRAHGLPVMAYSPIAHGHLLRNPALLHLARQHRVSPAQLAIAWALRQPGMIAIPKAATAAHVAENRAAAEIRFSRQEEAALDRAFPPPARKKPLAML